MKPAKDFVDGLLLKGRTYERGPDHFRALARMSWDAKLEQAFNPLITGTIKKGQSIEVTWVPTQSGKLEYFKLQCPPRTWLYSLNAGGEECVDPNEPYVWDLFHVDRPNMVLGVPVPFGETIVLRLGRKSDSEA